MLKAQGMVTENICGLTKGKAHFILHFSRLWEFKILHSVLQNVQNCYLEQSVPKSYSLEIFIITLLISSSLKIYQVLL